MEKEIIISTILDVCKDMGLNYITKVKSATWNADVVVEHDTYKVAFNVCKCPRNVEATYKAMRKERVCGCWLLLPAVNSSYQEQKDHEIRELGEFRTKRLVLEVWKKIEFDN